jgi:hypothetical protein
MQNTPTPATPETVNPAVLQLGGERPIPESQADGKEDDEDTTDPTPWYKSQPISSLSFAFFFMLWFTTGSYFLGQLNTVPTRVILKKEGCTYLRHLQVETQPYDEAAGMCSIVTPFRSDLIGNGGTFILKDRELKVTENPIVATEKLDSLPYTDSQKRMVVWLCINSALVLMAMIWAIFCLL